MDMVIAHILLYIGCLVNRPLYGKVFPFNSEHETKIDGHSGQVYENIEVSSQHRAHNDRIEYCERNIQTLTCKLIPKVIPPSITNVIVEDQDRHFEKHQFSDKSWTQVDSLHIEGENFNLRKGGLFKGLANLTTLYLNTSDIDRVNISCFRYLDGLKNLTLAGMSTLDGSSLQSAISKDGILPQLKYFALNSGKTIRSPFFQLQYNFLESLAEKHLECLNLSNVIVEVQFMDMINTLIQHSFKVVNLTGSYLIMKSVFLEAYVDKLPVSLSLPLVTTLDTSHLRAAYTATDLMSNLIYAANNSTDTVGRHEINNLLFFVENFYTNSILLDRTEYHGIFNFRSKARCIWKKVVFSGNYIAIVNLTLILPQNNTLLHLDLSHNKMEYITNGAFNTLFALQVLDLSGNRLYLMENLPEFEGLLVTLKNLRYFSLGSNNISFIPSKMFLTNDHLETIILANNRLISISFELGQFTKLCWLDIRHNRIMFLPNAEVDQIQSIQNKVKLDILFQGNPIFCSCETLRFISWLATLRGISGIPGDTLQCENVGSLIDVNEDAVGKWRYLCKRIMIIVLSTSCCLIVLITFLVMVRVIQNARKRKRNANSERLLKRSIREGRFVCFLAMSGKEEDIVNRVILQTLRLCLQEKVNVDRNIVCTGNRFKPGFPICEESYRLLKKSHVFMAVISDAFLRSQYCRLELQEACKQDKPTILLFLGHVDTTDMPEYMQEVFKRNSRAWIKQNDEGYYYVVPSVQDISDAMWDLALADLIRKV